MTAAIRAQLLAAGAKLPPEGQKPAATPRKAPAPTPVPPAPIEARTSEIKPKPEIPVSAPAFLDPETHLIGPYALSRAAGKHYPGRSRHTITGPDTPGLTEALAAALHAFTAKP
jgi:hypothetical protein